MERAKAKFQGRILSKFYIIQRVTRVELWIFAGCRFPWNSQSIFEGYYTGHTDSRGTYVVLILIFYLVISSRGRRGGLVVSELDSGSRGPGSSLGQVIVLCSWAGHFTRTVSLSTQEYKWIPGNCQRLACHPGGVAILLVASSCCGNRDKLRQ